MLGGILELDMDRRTEDITGGYRRRTQEPYTRKEAGANITRFTTRLHSSCRIVNSDGSGDLIWGRGCRDNDNNNIRICVCI